MIALDGWQKAHRILFTMAMERKLTPEEYVLACNYWDNLYAGYPFETNPEDPECPSCGSQRCHAGPRGCEGS